MKDILLFRTREYAAGILIWVIMILLSLLILFMVDFFGGIAVNAEGVFMKKKYEVAHTEEQIIWIGKTPTTQYYYVPESYSICLAVSGDDHWFPVSEWSYNTIEQRKQPIPCILVKGCITGHIYSGQLR